MGGLTERWWKGGAQSVLLQQHCRGPPMNVPTCMKSSGRLSLHQAHLLSCLGLVFVIIEQPRLDSLDSQLKFRAPNLSHRHVPSKLELGTGLVRPMVSSGVAHVSQRGTLTSPNMRGRCHNTTFQCSCSFALWIEDPVSWKLSLIQQFLIEVCMCPRNEPKIEHMARLPPAAGKEKN